MLIPMKRKDTMNRPLAALCAIGLAAASMIQTAAPAAARAPYARPVMTYNPNVNTGVRSFTLDDGKRVTVDANGIATVFDGSQIVDTRFVPASSVPVDPPGTDQYHSELNALSWAVEGTANAVPFAPGRVIVAFRDGTSISSDHLTVSPAIVQAMSSARSKQELYSNAPSYTNDTAVNHALADAGIMQSNRLFSGMQRATLSSMHAQAQARVNRPLLNIGNVFSLSISKGSVESAVAALRAIPSVAYASPDWTVSPMHTAPHALPDGERQTLRTVDPARVREAARLRSSSAALPMSATSGMTPANYAVSSNLQSLLDSSGIDDIAAYQEITSKFHELPGTGEIITNVSVGDIYAAEDGQGAATPNNPCPAQLKNYGPMTQMIGGQRYLNWPGLPLIAAYAADANGHTDPSYVSCAESDLSEVGLDFSMMAPLPDDQQRPGEQGGPANGDLLGIAPGATYRLYVPATNSPTQGGNFLSDIDGVFLAAAQQAPRTNVITASLGEGFDGYGFPGRYLEDDPLTQSVVASIVNDMNVVVCISANDGMRLFTPTAIGISGGSAPTNVVTDSTQTTNLNDLAYSTTPSLDVDSGAIDVGGTTLNDIYSLPPADPQYAASTMQLAFPETRYNGGQNLSSGFGSRVNVSAPADNVQALFKDRYNYDGVDLYNEGGTSASAPEVAAVAAVAMQIANRTGHPFTSARAVRDFLVQTATPVMQPALTDAPLNVGPQVNVRRAVEQLLANGGTPVQPALTRIGVFQRRVVYPLNTFETLFFTNTDPTHISLAGHDYGDGRGADGSGLTDLIDIAPDWQGMPAGAKYSLYVTGHPDRVLATTPTARLLPSTILQAAGTPVPLPSGAKVQLTYRAAVGLHQVAQGTVELDFGSTDGTSIVAPAPHVPGVVAGSSFQVTYDVSKARLMNNPMLVVSEPGRFTASWGFVVHFIYTVPLSQPSGTVTIPTSALQGAGIYGVGVAGTDPTHNTKHLSEMALVRVQAGSAARPPAPLLSDPAATTPVYSHEVETGYGKSISVKWDVTSVPNANGAELEVSAPGPTLAHIINTFNNPNGSQPDNNGAETGSVKVIPLSGLSGTMTFTPDQLGLSNTMFHTVRVIALNGGNGIGEGSDISSVIEDGQTNSIGGMLDHHLSNFSGGFAINPNGSDAMMAAALHLSTGWYLDSLDEFDQGTHAGKSLFGGYVAAPYSVRGGGLFGPDTALYGVGQNSNSIVGTSYRKVTSLGGVHPFQGNLTLPSTTDFLRQVSFNPGSATGAVLFQDTNVGYGTAPLQIAAFNPATSTLGTPVASKISNTYDNSVFLFGADMGLNDAVVLRSQFIDFTGHTPAFLDLVNLQTGATTTTQSVASGISDALAVDDTTHMALSNSVADNSLVLYNLQTGAQAKIQTPWTQTSIARGYTGGLSAFDAQFIAADPVNHLFLVYAQWGPGIDTADFNATSPLYVFDESGNCLKTITGWAFMSHGDISDNAAQYLQVNGNTRTAYLMDGSQLAIIHY